MASAPIRSSAPGKVILFGEHAVVYGRPAIAVPVTQVRATATVESGPPGSGLVLIAPDLGRRISLTTAPQDEPLAAAARFALAHLSAAEPDATLTVNSTIPIAGGLGSGAAVSTVIVRALAGCLGHRLEPAEVSALVFEVEKIHHGTPSGIDNTVVAYEQPVYFVREKPIERLTVGQPFTLLIGDTGVCSSTKSVVEHVRKAWKRNPARYDALFDQIGDIADEARQAIEAGDVDALGSLMDANHKLLIELGVSSPELDELVEAARLAGAMGAKLSGAGWGGNIIALVEDDLAEEVAGAVGEAGAVGVVCTRVVSQSVVVFLKLGGSLITDKTCPYTARHEVIARLAGEVRQALDAAQDLRLLIGHGSGSFGHWAARPYGTRQGVRTPAEWRGYAEVAAAAARLNRIVTDAFLEAGVPVLSLQPSASARCRDYVFQHLDTRPIHAALARGLVPLIYGDVALDDVQGGTIISTEDIFLYLADELRPACILLLGEVEGVLDSDGALIPHITPADLPTLQEMMGGSAGVDVTGGMADKVARMVELVRRHPETRVHILTGTKPGLLTRALLNDTLCVGTRITAQY